MYDGVELLTLRTVAVNTKVPIRVCSVHFPYSHIYHATTILPDM